MEESCRGLIQIQLRNYLTRFEENQKTLSHVFHVLVEKL
jgi:hypothetical protein